MIAFVDHLQRAASDEVAFYPRSALVEAIERDEIAIAFENGEPCGYLWRGPYRPGRDTIIYQAVIDYSLRRRHHGAGLVANLVSEAAALGATGVRCRCRSNLDANAFWRDLGFACIAVKPSGLRRLTEVNVWRHPIEAGLWDGLVVEPSTRELDRASYHRLRHLAPARSRFAR